MDLTAGGPWAKDGARRAAPARTHHARCLRAVAGQGDMYLCPLQGQGANASALGLLGL